MSRGRQAARIALLMMIVSTASACVGQLGSNAEEAPEEQDRDQGIDGMSSPDPDADQGRDRPDMTTASDAGEPDATMPIDEEMGGEMPPVTERVNPNTLPQAQLFRCADPSAPRSSPARLRRVLDSEWMRLVDEGITSEAAKNPLQPNPTNLYSTYDRDLSMEPVTLDQFLSMSQIPISTYYIKNYNCLKDGMKVPSDDCITGFVTELLERQVYFRPPTQEEVDQIVALTRANLAKEAPDVQDRKQTIQQVARGAWLTHGALFRSELGAEGADAQGRRHLSDWELARALASSLSDHAPGSPRYLSTLGLTPDGMMPDIRQAAIDGVISDREVIAAFVRKYLVGTDAGTMDPEALSYVLPPEIMSLTGKDKSLAVIEWSGRRELLRDRGANEIYDQFYRSRRSEYWMSDKLRSFFHEWLGYGQTESVFKDTAWATSRFETLESDKNRMRIAYNENVSPGISQLVSLDEQLDETIARIVQEDSDVIGQLMTTRRFFLKSSQPGGRDKAQAGYIYDIDTRVDPIPDTRNGRWRELPSTQRAGVLTHPAWLASHGGNFDNDPSAIHRGKWVREMLLCGTVPDVPISVAAQLDPETLDKPARQRVKDVTEQPQCAGCHGLMNPLGYPFEIYNHAGYLRADDHGFAPDGSSTLLHMPQGDDALSEAMAVRDAVEMMEAFGASTHVKRCVIRQSFRYFMGRDETMADACTLADMEQSYDMSGGSFTEMLVTLFTSDTFLYRTFIMQEAQP